ncbi:MAG: glycosyltransferase family 4 protein [Xanthobacteraceae bacterium]|jgi:UDP-N-acetylmuramyl pentapeptide phosphotransferase/UDP-N-acetylglucosamine-1-phosphate transferase
MQDSLTAFAALAILLAAAVFSAVLIVALGPWLAHYAMAKPNARSSHKAPTPQGGGIAVISATLVVSGGVLLVSEKVNDNSWPLVVIATAVLLIAGVGVMADKRPIAPAPRLVLQTFAVAAVLATLPPELRLLPVLPWWSERILLLIGTLWFVNLVNFMDGIDWLTVAEAVPIAATIALIGFFGKLPPAAIVVSLALCGATVGFAFFNRPTARLFLGDVGSLPIGLLLGWLLLVLAGNGGRAAAILLPLYYLADSTITLLRRAVNREPVWQAHRSHFYQRATDSGFTVLEIVARVFVANIALAGLALATILLPSRTTDIVGVGTGMALVAWLLVVFARGPRPA